MWKEEKRKKEANSRQRADLCVPVSMHVCVCGFVCTQVHVYLCNVGLTCLASCDLNCL